MEEYKFLGALLDNRSEDKKKKDFFLHEIVACVNPVKWVEKNKEQWRRFPDQDQDGSSSCVAQTIKKLALILLWLKEKTIETFSATPIYQERSNKPGGGMIGVEAFDIWIKNGITLESLVPSDKLSEEQMNCYKIEQYKKDVGKTFKIHGHIGIEKPNFDTVCSVIQTTGKGVMIWFYFTSAEWSKEIPTVDADYPLIDERVHRHSVAAVDCFLYNGKEYILVEDSAHFGGWKYHLISREMFEKRCFFSRYPMNFVFEDKTKVYPQDIPDPVMKPRHTFEKALSFGETDIDIKCLQDILKYEGFFPVNVSSTGYYGALTAKAVLGWQKRHVLAAPGELENLQGRTVGVKTLKALNEIYA